jgi:ACR3 family arsenite transporter
VAFLEIPFVRLRAAFTNTRYLGAALGTNSLVVPAYLLPALPATGRPADAD